MRQPKERSAGRRGSLLVLGAVAALLVAVSALAGPRTGGAPAELVIEPALLGKLQTLAEGLHNEIVLCLEGEAEGDTARAVSFYMPAPVHSSATRSASASCPPGTLATWHNHPAGRAYEHLLSGGRLSLHRFGSGTDSVAGSLCVLSTSDIVTAIRLGYPFVVVSVDATTWCWWGLQEVRQLARAGEARARPAPERLLFGDAGAAGPASPPPLP